MGSANLLSTCSTISGFAILALLNKPMRAGVTALAGPLEKGGRRFDCAPLVGAI